MRVIKSAKRKLAVVAMVLCVLLSATAVFNPPAVDAEESALCWEVLPYMWRGQVAMTQVPCGVSSGGGTIHHY